MRRHSSEQWNDADERLNLFLHRAHELRNTEAVRMRFPTGFNFKWDRKAGMSMHVRQPGEETVRSMLMSFRLFVSKSDPVFIPGITKLCLRYLSSAQLQQALVDSRDHYKRKMRHSGIGLEIDGREYSPEYVLDLWLNGWYFHSDQAKYRELSSFMPPEFLLTKFKFLEVVTAGIDHVLDVEDIVRQGRSDGSLRVA